MSTLYCLYLQVENESIQPMSNQTMQQTIAEYFKTQPVLKAWLFGSYARGECTTEPTPLCT